MLFGIILALAFVYLTAIPVASAKTTDFWACFDHKEVRTYCSNYRPPETCDISTGCKICMSEYREAEDCYVGGNFNDCTRFADPACANDGTTTNFDLTAPNMVINNPIQNQIYQTKNILLNFETDEEAEVSYTNLADSRVSWSKVCRDCTTYSMLKTFDEGLNQLMFRARDSVGNPGYYNVTFRVDSMVPKIYKTNPSRGWANGEFDVEFKEENPTNLVLHYGNDITGNRTKSIDLNSCEYNKKTICKTVVDLKDYDGEEMKYHFELTDIANNVDTSKPVTLSVDSTKPVINNNDLYTIDGKYVYFKVSVIEQNFDEIVYSYLDSRERLKESRLCSKLNNENICEKRVSFKEGNHDIKLIVRDEAGNEEIRDLSFFTDSKKPKISKITPNRGWANGEFEVQFTEENPTELMFHYGNDITGYNSKNIALTNENCIFDRKTICTTEVDLGNYDGEEIEVWFTLKDKVGQTDESKKYDLDVDTTFPVINNKDLFSIDGRYVYFNLDITEENFEEVTYMDLDDSNPREKRLCSRLKDGICEKRVRFSVGNHELTIQVYDEAGNSIGVPAGFTITK